MLRPRDVIGFCQEAVQNAQRAGRIKVDEDDVFVAWESSGQNILMQAHTEFQHKYPRLADLVLGLSELPFEMEWRDVQTILTNRGQKITHDEDWLKKGLEDPVVLLAGLYEAGIVGIRRTSSSVWYESARQFEDLRVDLEPNSTIVIHPALRAYLMSQGNPA